MSGLLVRTRSKPAFQQVLKEMAHREKQEKHTFADTCKHCYQQYAYFLNKYSRLAAARMKICHLPSRNDICTQADLLCRDYIYYKLKKQSLLSLKLEIIIGQSTRFRPGGTSLEVITLATELERMYPELYQNVSKQVQLTMSTPDVITRIMTSVADVLYATERDITWGRIIALFALAGAIATDCVKQGQAKLVKDVIATFTHIVDTKLAGWMRIRGGWAGLTSACRRQQHEWTVILLTGMGALSGCLTTLALLLHF